MPSLPPDSDELIMNMARQCIMQERDALSQLANQITPVFANSIRLLLECKGRVIVTGIGKSGHVGRKIAASLASTGCPAFFVHASEASHGDLGMITHHDIIIALSNSGMTNELMDILNYCASHHIPIIGITQKKDSFLANIATHPLFISEGDEAGELGLAPTTSTTQMLALGDAICISLLEVKGFSKEDFGRFHPGGKLGQQLMRVEDLMHKGDILPLVPHTMHMHEAILAMASKPFGIIGAVNDKGHLVGIVTDGDLRRAWVDDLWQQQVHDIMNNAPYYATQHTLAAHIIAMMNEHKFNVVFIVDDLTTNHPIGIVHLHDFIRAGII